MKTAQDVKQVREQLGMTQKQLADALGVARNYIYMIEAGKTPVSKKIDSALDSFLQGDEGNAASPPSSAIGQQLSAICAQLNRIATALEQLLAK